MSVELAKAYIECMHADEVFRCRINAGTDEHANWRFQKESGYEFSVEEFKQATKLICDEYVVTPR